MLDESLSGRVADMPVFAIAHGKSRPDPDGHCRHKSQKVKRHYSNSQRKRQDY
jgi:hypothetical protein